MKIQGVVLDVTNTADAKLTRGKQVYVVTVSPISSDFYRKYREQIGVIKYPSPPKVPQQVKGEYVRDERGAVVVVRNTEDPEYVQACVAINRRYMGLRMLDLLRNSNVEFTAVEPTGTDLGEWQKYAEALHSEVLDSKTGFTDEEVNKLIKLSDGLAATIEVEKSLKHFLSE